ncbi:hypothetical protein CEP51_014043 [Fusarium floridanum]|uniref:Uncharacterized protein n=1 Tax=Fusarium floridanum TaxID=1325733 RepID=A0A428Q0C5_9HYPO|nr:hypothetical protein CEP51_014043 [Fusarium floridanum]
MSVQECQYLLNALLDQTYNQNKPGANVYRGQWTMILHHPGVQASLHASYDGPGDAFYKFLQIHGRPAVKTVLQRLARQGAGFQETYQTGRDTFTFTFTAENSLEAVDDFFDSE